VTEGTKDLVFDRDFVEPYYDSLAALLWLVLGHPGMASYLAYRESILLVSV